MKTVFIVNPKAGQGKNINKLTDSIKQKIQSLNTDAEIYITKHEDAARVFVAVKSLISKTKPENEELVK